MFWDSDTKYPSRKYVDLLWTSCAKYSVWNPSYDNIQVGGYGQVPFSTADSIVTQVGDYGVINRETGQFDRNGNIYEEGFVPSHPGKHAPREYSGSTGVISVTSLNARAVRVVPSINMDAQVAKLKFQVLRRLSIQGKIHVTFYPHIGPMGFLKRYRRGVSSV